MKKLVGPIIILICLFSCDKSDDNPIEQQFDFNQKILDGYWVVSIAFDKIGNAWIGTFKQVLIKYNSNDTVGYNSKNSIIPDTAVIWDIAVDSKNNVWIGCEGLIKYNGEVSSTELNSIDPNTIESVTVLKDQSATNAYGELGNNGVILITTKNYVKPDASKDQESEALILLDGECSIYCTWNDR